MSNLAQKRDFLKIIKMMTKHVMRNRKAASARNNILRHPTPVVIAILAVFITVGICSASLKAPTFDETAHILGGYTTLTTRDYHINPENGLLPQVWAAIPLALSPRIIPPDTHSRIWKSGLRWNSASNFLFTSGNDHDSMLIKTRTMSLLMAAACGLLVFLISKHIWGTGGGLLSLTLFVLSPTIMANARLVTSDMACALFFLLSIWAYQRVTEKITLSRLIMFCVGMSCLFLSKMSAPIIIPALLALLAVRLFRRKPLRVDFGGANFAIAGQFKQTLALVAAIVLAGTAIFASIWASASFRYSMLPNNDVRAHQNAEWGLIEKDDSLPVKVVLFAKSHKLLPEYYLFGMGHVLHESKLRHAFLNGKRSQTGWWYFFPATFAMKTPPEMILLFIAGLIAPFLMIGKKRRMEEGTIEKYIEHSTSNVQHRTGEGKIEEEENFEHRIKEKERKEKNIQCRIANNQYSIERLRRISILRRLAFAFVLIATYVAFSLATDLNIGHRHLLPIYPPLFIIAGGLAFAVTQALVTPKLREGGSRLIPQSNACVPLAPTGVSPECNACVPLAPQCSATVSVAPTGDSPECNSSVPLDSPVSSNRLFRRSFAKADLGCSPHSNTPSPTKTLTAKKSSSLSRRALQTLLYLSIIALLIENILIYPDYLAYFSPLVGGASNGYKHLVDSSLDWGQDLKRLKTYIQSANKRGEKHIYSAYFGSVNLTAYQLPGKRLLCAFEQFSNDIFPLRPGTYCLSATMLQMDYDPALAEWNPELEHLYRDYRERFRELRTAMAKGRNMTKSPKQMNELFHDYKIFAKLRFAKLAATLRTKEPDDNIGHSILIYKLSKQDLHDILK